MGKRDRQTPSAITSGDGAEAMTRSDDAPVKEESGFDLKLIVLIILWYVGNYNHNITNKLALNAGGGALGYPLTISTGFLGVGVIYALFMWMAPDGRPMPNITFSDYLRTLPVSFAAAGAHMASCFALSAGSLSFTQIIKGTEPAFAALIGVLFYGSQVSAARWLCLIPVIGGVALASMGELSINWLALFIACVANAFAAIKSNENSKLFATPGLKERMGSVGNQFAITTINAFFFCLALSFFIEGHKFGSFVELVRAGGKGTALLNNMIASGLWMYMYSEVATDIIKKTSAVTQSVLNTAKRAFVIVGAAIILKEGLSTEKLVGSAICIGGVFLYSVIDGYMAKM